MIEVDGPGFDKGQQAELNRGRIAARVRHQARVLDLSAMRFRKAVHRLGEKLGRCVLHLIPLLPLGDFPYAEIGRQVHDAHAGLDQRPRLAHRDGIGCREKHHVAAAEVRLGRV